MTGGTLMELSDKSLEIIGRYVKENLADWMKEVAGTPKSLQTGGPSNIPPSAPEPFTEAGQTSPRGLPDSVLLERLIRLEEELNAQRIIMGTRFEAIDKRFDDLIHYMDKRFSSVQWVMGLGFTLLAALMAVFNFF